jgi:hypothetical protein
VAWRDGRREEDNDVRRAKSKFLEGKYGSLDRLTVGLSETWQDFKRFALGVRKARGKGDGCLERLAREVCRWIAVSEK